MQDFEWGLTLCFVGTIKTGRAIGTLAPSSAAKSRSEVAELVRSQRDFAVQMKNYFPEIKAPDRDALLKEIWRMAKIKKFLEQYRRSEKEEEMAEEFRERRRWLLQVEKQLREGIRVMEEIRNVAMKYPRSDAKGNSAGLAYWDEMDRVIKHKTFNALGRAGTALGRAIMLVQHDQYALAAAVHPHLRTRTENRLVPEEPRGLKHKLLLREKTRRIDLEFITRAEAILNKYRTTDGAPVPRQDQIIATVFRVAFGVMKPEDTIRRYLSRNQSIRQF